MKPFILLFMSLTFLGGCSTVSGWLGFAEDTPHASDSSSEHTKTLPTQGAHSPKPASSEDLELRIARLSSRIDELETQLVQQKERSKLIEKGLLLGLVPEELKSESYVDAVKSKPHHETEDKPIAKLSAAKLLEVKPSHETAKVETSSDRALYRKMLESAQDQFNRAKYGQAIAAYSEIGTKFDDSITEGSHHYWTGLCWFYLKEYKLSEENFSSLKDRFPSSPWVPYAEFYLAKVDLSRGFQQRALDRFQKLLDENPTRDLGEMAQAEIERMKEKL